MKPRSMAKFAPADARRNWDPVVQAAASPGSSCCTRKEARPRSTDAIHTDLLKRPVDVLVTGHRSCGGLFDHTSRPAWPWTQRVEMGGSAAERVHGHSADEYTCQNDAAGITSRYDRTGDPCAGSVPGRAGHALERCPRGPGRGQSYADDRERASRVATRAA